MRINLKRGICLSAFMVLAMLSGTTSAEPAAETPPPELQTVAPTTEEAAPSEALPPEEAMPQEMVEGMPAPELPLELASPAGDSAVQAVEAEAAPPEPTPAPPPTAPYVTGFDQISSGDTAWMLTSTALVLLMTIPGLALFYAGMVRKKNALATALQSFAICCLMSVIWVVVGYSLAFTPGNMFIGGFDRVMLEGLTYFKQANELSVSHIAPAIPESVFIMFQMTFAIITPALITGAFAERMKFSAMVVFMVLWSILVYAPVAHWVWEPGGWLASQGVLDFAGGTVVHINAGIAGLVCAYMLGARRGFGREPFPPYNLVYTLIGASLLWVGWFGFNAGSAVAADGRAGMAMLVTQLATATGALTWMMIEWIKKKHATLLGAVSGALGGLVAITPASGFVGVPGALAIGLAAGLFCYWGATGLKRLLGADDSLDVFGIHGVGGLVGAILTGVFVDKAIGGVDANITLQVIGAFSTLLYSGIVTWVILWVVDTFVGLRVTPEDEYDGLDISQHAERVTS